MSVKKSRCGWNGTPLYRLSVMPPTFCLCRHAKVNQVNVVWSSLSITFSREGPRAWVPCPSEDASELGHSIQGTPKASYLQHGGFQVLHVG